MKTHKLIKLLTDADKVYSSVVERERKLGQFGTNEVAINEFIAEGISFGKKQESINFLDLLKLKCKTRIRGLEVDRTNGYQVDRAILEYEELLRHLEQLSYIIADVSCAEKYLNKEEKNIFANLKKYYGVDDEE